MGLSEFARILVGVAVLSCILGQAAGLQGGPALIKDIDNVTMKRRGRISAVTTAFLESDAVLRRFLSRFLVNEQDIEDVAQEAYLRAYVAEQSRKIDQPRRYLFRTARNVALNTLTRKSKQITDYLEESNPSIVVDRTTSTELELEAREAFGLYCEAVAALPKKCRQVYLLRKVHGLSHREIAERMSLTVSSVEKYLLRGVRETRAYAAAQVHKGRQ